MYPISDRLTLFYDYCALVSEVGGLNGELRSSEGIDGAVDGKQGGPVRWQQPHTVLINREIVALLDHQVCSKLPLTKSEGFVQVDVLVGNRGRCHYGYQLKDKKGIFFWGGGGSFIDAELSTL